MFVVDALGQWLIEQLADAGRKKLTELVLGSEQERALRRAADAAVWATAEEMSPSGSGQRRRRRPSWRPTRRCRGMRWTPRLPAAEEAAQELDVDELIAGLLG
jgi:hypothetical protein